MPARHNPNELRLKCFSRPVERRCGDAPPRMLVGTVSYRKRTNEYTPLVGLATRHAVQIRGQRIMTGPTRSGTACTSPRDWACPKHFAMTKTGLSGWRAAHSITFCGCRSRAEGHH